MALVVLGRTLPEGVHAGTGVDFVTGGLHDYVTHNADTVPNGSDDGGAR